MGAKCTQCIEPGRGRGPTQGSHGEVRTSAPKTQKSTNRNAQKAAQTHTSFSPRVALWCNRDNRDLQVRKGHSFLGAQLRARGSWSREAHREAALSRWARCSRVAQLLSVTGCPGRCQPFILCSLGRPKEIRLHTGSFVFEGSAAGRTPVCWPVSKP